MNKNPNCDGGHCASATGEVRVLPYSKDGNLILCQACYAREINYRVGRNHELGHNAFDLPTWASLKVYPEPESSSPTTTTNPFPKGRWT